MSDKASPEPGLAWTHRDVHVANEWGIQGGQGTCGVCGTVAAGAAIAADHASTFICNQCLLPRIAPKLLARMDELLSQVPPTPEEELGHLVEKLHPDDIANVLNALRHVHAQREEEKPDAETETDDDATQH